MTTPHSIRRATTHACVSATVTATTGNDGVLVGSSTSNNTENNTSTTAFAGSRSLALNDDTSRMRTGTLTEASLDDGTFTVQFAYYADNTSGFGTGNYVRLVECGSANTQFRFASNNGSSTAFDFYVGGTNYAVTLDDINTASWHLIRIY